MPDTCQVTLTTCIPEMMDTARRLAELVVAKTTADIETDCKRRINEGPKTGRIYPRGKGQVHQASAPGEAPATDTGFLANSIQSIIRALVGIIAYFAEYAPGREFGTERIAARPSLQPSVEAQREKFVNAMAEIIRAGSLK